MQYLKLAKLVFFLIMYLHCLACIWFLIVEQDKTWIPPLDYVFIETEVYQQTNAYQYWISLYHSVLMLTGNDVGPRGNYQVTLFILNYRSLYALPVSS